MSLAPLSQQKESVTSSVQRDTEVFFSFTIYAVNNILYICEYEMKQGSYNWYNCDFRT